MPFELHFKEIIRKRGNKYVVLSKDGKKLLGTHDTKKDALAQLKAIEISKSRGKNKMNTNERINKLHEKMELGEQINLTKFALDLSKSPKVKSAFIKFDNAIDDQMTRIPGITADEIEKINLKKVVLDVVKILLR